MRHILLACTVLCFGLGVALADEPKGPRAQKLAKLQKKFDGDEADMKKKLADAKEADEKQQIVFLMKELYAFTAGDAIELAEEAKKDETALDACVLALKLLGKVKLTGENMDNLRKLMSRLAFGSDSSIGLALNARHRSGIPATP